MLVLDGLATRYHLLPSEVLRRADTLDWLVMDVALAWHRYQQEQAEAKAKGGVPAAPNIPINTLQAMIERVRK